MTTKDIEIGFHKVNGKFVEGVYITNIPEEN
jgi:hypothetical protein